MFPPSLSLRSVARMWSASASASSAAVTTTSRATSLSSSSSSSSSSQSFTLARMMSSTTLSNTSITTSHASLAHIPLVHTRRIATLPETDSSTTTTTTTATPRKASSSSSSIFDSRAAARAKRQAAKERSSRKLDRSIVRQQARQRQLAADASEVKIKTNLEGIDESRQNMLGDAIDIAEHALSADERLDMWRVGSYNTGSSKELLRGRIETIFAKYSKKPGDTGSSEVQVAILTERINILVAHTNTIRKDVKARRQLYILRERRRKLLKYLRRRNFVSYEMMMKVCRVSEAEIDGEGRTEKSGNQAKRVPRD